MGGSQSQKLVRACNPSFQKGTNVWSGIGVSLASHLRVLTICQRCVHSGCPSWPLSSGVSNPNLTLICCSLAPLSSSVLATSLSFLLCILASLSSAASATSLYLLCCCHSLIASEVHLALSLILHFLNFSSLCSTVSEVRWAFSHSLRLCKLFSLFLYWLSELIHLDVFTWLPDQIV